MNPNIAAVFELYNWWIRDKMPEDGGLLKQPALLLKAFRVIELYMDEARNCL
jgi:hypothetical protein